MGRAASGTRITLNAAHCVMTISQPATRVVLIEIEGLDLGELDRAPFLYLNDLLQRGRPLKLFIDARRARGPSIDVSAQWARWLLRNRDQLQRVNMLASPRGLVRVTAEFVGRFTELGDRMRVSTDPGMFEAELSVASM